MRIKAYAKINLGLDVTGKRPDGYHEVKMVMQTVDIADELTIEKTEGGIEVFSDCGELPGDENNLAYKAAKLMVDEYGIGEGVKVTLKKRIPIAAGMAGGSTDAAGVMNGINELFKLKLKPEELQKQGVKLGADVPYCITGGTVLAEGIGEKLTPLRSVSQCVLLVAKPEINVSTGYVYEHLDAEPDYDHPDIDGMVRALEDGNLDGVVRRLGNVLENVTQKKYPVVEEIRDAMNAGGAKGSMMSGSGPSVFGIFDTILKAQEAERLIRNSNLAQQVFVTRFVDRSWRRMDG